MAVIVSVNGTPFPEAGGYLVSVEDIVTNQLRSPTTGTLKADWVAQKKRIDISYQYLTKTQLSGILALIKPGTKAGFFFSVTYVDPNTGTTASGTFYAGSVKTGTFKFNSSTGDIEWKDVKIPLIEQ